MTVEEEIQKRINEVSKTLKPTDRVRWKWGYVDGLKEALKIISKRKEKP